MKLNPIINSLLEQDMYKYSMTMCVFHQFPDYTTTWTFKCRNKDVFFTPEMVEEIKEQIKHYCTLRYTEEELAYLQNIPWIKKPYVDFLRFWHPRYEEFNISTNDPCGLAITTSGSWLCTSFYEVVTLAIVNEVYFRMQYNYDELMDGFKARLNEKVKLLETGECQLNTFSEFGLRRRLSHEAQDLVVETLKNTNMIGSTFVGTSNVYMARKHKTKAIGTTAHEYILAVGQGNPKINPAYSNHYYLESWVKEYGVQNGIALTDTITTDCFLRDFKETYCHLFSGVRHDSSDPIEWAHKMINHYKSFGIDPRSKTFLFSDSLDFNRANNIREQVGHLCNVAFGIGTFLTNDTGIVPALNIVMKPTIVNNQYCAKLSDCEGKNMCTNPEYIDYLKRCVAWRMEHE